MKLSQRVQNLTPSQTIAITAKARELKAEGLDVIGLGAGEPDFNTPDEIIEKTYESLKKGETKYTPASGIPELKKAIIKKMARDNNLDYSMDEIFVGNGAKHVLYNVFQAVLDEGDEVLVPTPYWVSYTEQVKLAEGTPVLIETDESTSFKLTPELLDQHVNEKTRMLVLNSPNNPSGMVYTKEELKALADYLEKTDIIVVADEIYEVLVYDGEHISIASFSEKIKKQTVVINGVSKSHSMTGWRIGYACADSALIKGMTGLASQSTSNPTTPAQWAAVAAYEMDKTFLDSYNETFRNRRDHAYDLLMTVPHVECIKPEGAFYLFPNFKTTAVKCGFQTVDKFVTALLEDKQVAVVPGSAFGLDDNIRISYSISEEMMTEAMTRIKNFVTERIEGV
ncbi:pyridoxal phosphate-dependent aminotransferase [Corticicoccus populi]|uniref:Aminotransferase n=1 Tax=Corticicoccus populi TaxID=1812821 RepID=A0ABW5WVS4_9STAP